MALWALVLASVGALLESLPISDLDELRTMAAAAANLLGVATTPLARYSAEEIGQSELHWGVRRMLQLLDLAEPAADSRGALQVAANDLIALRQQLSDRIRTGLLPSMHLASTPDSQRPRNDEAYTLFMQATAMSTDPTLVASISAFGSDPACGRASWGSLATAAA